VIATGRIAYANARVRALRSQLIDADMVRRLLASPAAQFSETDREGADLDQPLVGSDLPRRSFRRLLKCYGVVLASITHPIPDLTGYVTEGQIVLDRELDRRGVYPPVAVLPSLSRLMNDGIGSGRTREDHADVARQLYASVARVARARSLESIIGREELSAIERQYLEFGSAFEQRFLAQQLDDARPIGRTLDLALETLAILPDRELNHLPAALLQHVRQPLRPEAGADARGTVE